MQTASIWEAHMRGIPNLRCVAYAYVGSYIHVMVNLAKLLGAVGMAHSSRTWRNVSNAVLLCLRGGFGSVERCKYDSINLHQTVLSSASFPTGNRCNVGSPTLRRRGPVFGEGGLGVLEEVSICPIPNLDLTFAMIPFPSSSASLFLPSHISRDSRSRSFFDKEVLSRCSSVSVWQAFFRDKRYALVSQSFSTPTHPQL